MSVRLGRIEGKEKAGIHVPGANPLKISIIGQMDMMRRVASMCLNPVRANTYGPLDKSMVFKVQKCKTRLMVFLRQARWMMAVSSGRIVNNA